MGLDARTTAERGTSPPLGSHQLAPAEETQRMRYMPLRGSLSRKSNAAWQIHIVTFDSQFLDFELMCKEPDPKSGNGITERFASVHNYCSGADCQI